MPVNVNMHFFPMTCMLTLSKCDFFLCQHAAPFPDVEDIIKVLFSNKWEQAARGFQNIYHGGGSGAPSSPRSGITKEANQDLNILY